ncbi:hypothetical protein MTO96_052049 [Rhipicephalus appendiculatus]
MCHILTTTKQSRAPARFVPVRERQRARRQFVGEGNSRGGPAVAVSKAADTVQGENKSRKTTRRGLERADKVCLPLLPAGPLLFLGPFV